MRNQNELTGFRVRRALPQKRQRGCRSPKRFARRAECTTPLTPVESVYRRKERTNMEPPYLAQIATFSGDFEPCNWLFCDGKLLPIFEFDLLFMLIGTQYGGDGVN